VRGVETAVDEPEERLGGQPQRTARDLIGPGVEANSVGGEGEPERVWGQATTSNYFDVARLRMVMGRGFSSEEERLPVIVLSQRLWRRRFASSPAILGKSSL
jgi:hypothetical protein